MSQKYFKKAVIGIALTSLLAGCAASRQASDDYSTTRSTATDLAKSASNVAPADLFSKTDEFYVDKTPIVATQFADKSADLPDFFRKKASMNIQTPTPLSEIIARLSHISGAPVRIQQDLLDGTEGQFGQMIGNEGKGEVSSSSSSSSSSGGGSAGAGGDKNNKLTINDVVYTGDLAGLLDNLTDKLNLSWRWDGNSIQIYRYATKMFRLNALAGIAQVNASLNTAASTTGGGGSGASTSSAQSATSGQTTTMSDVTAIWADVGSALQSSLSPKGKMSMIPSAGTITVTDTPDVLNQMENQIKEFNQIYSKQVLLNIQVYQVESTDSDNYGIDWSTVWSFAGGKWGINVSTNGNNTDTSGQTFTLTGKGGSLVNGSAIVEALSKAGKTSLVTSGSVISLNGQTVPLNVSREKAYVASAETTVSGDSGVSSSSITPGVVTEGFAMNFTPRVTDNNTVIMRYTVDLSSIEEIVNFTSGDSTVQLPQRLVRNFMQNVSVKSGQTLVLTGFQQVQGTDTSSGVGSPFAWFLGGKKQAESTNRTIVIIVTPYITK